MQKSTIILLVIVGAVLVLGLMFMVGLANSPTGPEVEYNYEVEIVDSFISDHGSVETPSQGKQFAILTYHIYNLSYSKGISTNPFTWQMEISIGGLRYDWSTWYTYLYPGQQTVDVLKGADATSVQVFEIPEGHSLSDLKVSLDTTLIFAKVRYNPDLEV